MMVINFEGISKRHKNTTFVDDKGLKKRSRLAIFFNASFGKWNGFTLV